MWLDALALLLLGFFAGVGAWRGGLASGLSLATLAAAYVAAILAASWLGPMAAGIAGVPELIGVAVAGCAAFALVFVAMGIVSFVLRRMERASLDGPRSLRDRFLGGVFGAVRGGVVVLLLAVLANWVDALRATGTVEGLPELAHSPAAILADKGVEAGVESALSEHGSTAKVVARMAARPAVAFTDLQHVLESPALERLRGDQLFWTYVEHGSIDAALNRGPFLQIIHDDDLRGQLAGLGLIEEEAARNPAAFREAAGDVLREVGPRIRGLREDPELQRLMEDPEVVALVQSGDTLGLMGHEGFRNLVARVAAKETSGS